MKTIKKITDYNRAKIKNIIRVMIRGVNIIKWVSR